MSIGTICYPAMPKPAEKQIEVEQTSFDSRDVAIVCLSGAMVLVLIALIIVLARQPANYGSLNY